ncbi:glycosyltransferase [Hyphococcus sp.]|jgi:glycosyltransferase involved in cell wall biosynthesis|uniref:glycosyltransferase n=1 Tax=Hyphococcus sp. TaxID=2038636 RepID=UPI003D128A03
MTEQQGPARGPASVGKAAFFSEKQFQCGASIAALRVAVEMSRRGLDVDYHFQEASKSPYLRDLYPSVRFNRLTALHSEYAQEAYEEAKAFGPHIAKAAGVRLFEQNLRMTLKAGDVDVAHIHNYSGSRETITSIAESKPLIWTMHDTSPVTGYHYRTYDLNEEPLEYRAKTAPASEAFWASLKNKPFCLTAPSEWLAGYARASVPDHIRVRMIPNMLMSNTFYPMNKSLARALVGLPEDGLFILFFAGKGAWQRKNFEIIARAFAKAPDLPINIVVVGGVADGRLVRDGRMMFRQGYDPAVDAAKIVALYNAVDAFCISSLIDNLPNTVLEAISCGRPVIGANVGGVPDMVEDGVNGWLFDPRDVSSAVSALRRFHQDAGRLDEMGAASLRIAKARYSREVVADAFLDLYTELRQSYLGAQSKMALSA